MNLALVDTSHDGEFVVVSVSGDLVTVPVVGRHAFVNVCCYSGTFDVDLETPADCVTPRTLTCP